MNKQSWMIIQKKRGRARTSHMDDNCTNVKGFIREESCIEIAEMNGIPKSCAHEIICDFNVCKILDRWVLKMLSEEQKTNQMGASLENLIQQNTNRKGFLSLTVWLLEMKLEFTSSPQRQNILWYGNILLQLKKYSKFNHLPSKR